MIKVKERTFLQKLANSPYVFEIDCDNCNCQTHAGGEIGLDGLFVQLYGNHDIEVICNSCFNKGLSNFRAEDYQHRAGILHSRPKIPQERSCSLCNEILPNATSGLEVINLTQKFICNECAHTSHPDDKHSYFPNTDWGVCSCGTLRLGNRGNRKYWSLSNSEPSATIPFCSAKFINKYSCDHDFVYIEDFTKDQSSVKKMKKSELRQFGAPGEFITRADFIYGTCGYKLFWCKKCGETKRELPDWHYKFL